MLTARKEIPLVLTDGKEYIFSERNKCDSDFNSYQSKVRAYRVRFWEDNLKDEDRKLIMIMQESRAIYSPTEIQLYIYENVDAQKHVLYDSFKIKNDSISFDKFCLLLGNDESIKKLVDVIYNLEGLDFSDKKKDINQTELS